MATNDGTGFYFLGGTFTLQLATDSSGNIVQWNIYGWDGYPGSGHAIWTNNSYDMSSQMNEGGNSNDPGTWTSNASPVPEPCSIALALTGVGALVARRRKKSLIATK